MPAETRLRKTKLSLPFSMGGPTCSTSPRFVKVASIGPAAAT